MSVKVMCLYFAKFSKAVFLVVIIVVVIVIFI